MWSKEGISAAKVEWFIKQLKPKIESDSTISNAKIHSTISKPKTESSISKPSRARAGHDGTSLAKADLDGISRAQSALRRMSLANADLDEIGRAQEALAEMSIDGPRDNFDQFGEPIITTPINGRGGKKHKSKQTKLRSKKYKRKRSMKTRTRRFRR